jgi:hypothetical protein
VLQSRKTFWIAQSLSRRGHDPRNLRSIFDDAHIEQQAQIIYVQFD